MSIHAMDLIVFSHLRWSFVWQRPQHLLSRLAKHHRIFFIEEPEYSEGASPRWNTEQPLPDVFVCRAVTPNPEPGFHESQHDLMRGLIESLQVSQNIDEYALWFYTPMALPLAENLQPRLVIYDCMDELSAFLHAPVELIELEDQLLQRADVVFTGGPSLFRAKCDRHPNVHCFSSSVDADHFRQALGEIEEPPGQKEIPYPRLGFFGVIDERFDMGLLRATAEAQPDWQFVMVGPIVKIDPSQLPTHENIHYMGQRSYEDLPRFLKGWDVCLLPFARNEATRFISPTKTLEYMAAEKPIVSTSIVDVAEPYGDIVYLGDSPDVFVAACHRAMTASEAERSARLRKMHDVIAKTSWESTVEKMEAELRTLLQRRKDREGLQPSDRNAAENWTKHEHRSPIVSRSGESRTPAELPDDATEEDANDSDSPPVVVIGAGPTGLSAAYHLGEDALLIERNAEVGGWCRSIELDGFTFDFAGHIMFSNDPYVHEMYEMLLGDNVHWQDREAWVYSKNVYTRYPFQGALYGLPPQVIKECLAGAIECRFGTLSPSTQEKSSAVPRNSESSHINGKQQSGKNGHDQNSKRSGNGTTECSAVRLLPAGDEIDDCCGDGILESTTPLAKEVPSQPAPNTPANFEEFIYKVWGRGIAKHFAIPYNRKLWAVPLNEMETSWLGGRVPLPDLEEMIEGALSPVPKPMGPNARFGYPLRGGFQSLMSGFLPHLKGPLRLQTEITGFAPSRHEVTLSTGEVLNYQHLISTMPLPVLIRLAGDEAPPEIQDAAKGLRYISVRCVHLGIGRENLTDKHWIYYPEDSVFHRIFVQGNASPYCNPAGGFGLTCEITYDSQHKPLPCDGDDLIQLCIDDCRRVGIISSDDPVLTATQVDLPHAYVIYDHQRAQRVALIRNWLISQDVILAGRYSEWEYYNSDHAFLAGKKAADKVQARLALMKRQELSTK